MTDDPRPDFAALAREASDALWKAAMQHYHAGHQCAGDWDAAVVSILSPLLSRVVQEREAQVWDRAIEIAKSEPELPGEPEPKHLKRMRKNIVPALRAAVVTTKGCIAERLRQAKKGGTP